MAMNRRHPGVTLLKPDAVKRIGWRARWKDPSTGKYVKKTIPPSRATTVELRVAWAIEKSVALGKRLPPRPSEPRFLRRHRPQQEAGPRPLNKRERFKVLERDAFRCVYCGRSSKGWRSRSIT